MTVPDAGTRAAAPMTLAEFFEGVRAGRVAVQRCTACGELAVPPRTFCSACQGAAFGRLTLAGEGEVVSFTVIRVAPAALAREAPYVIAVTRFPEGVSLLGRLDGLPIEAAAVGLPVRLTAPTDPGASPPVPRFVPRGAAPAT